MLAFLLVWCFSLELPGQSAEACLKEVAQGRHRSREKSRHLTSNGKGGLIKRHFAGCTMTTNGVIIHLPYPAKRTYVLT